MSHPDSQSLLTEAQAARLRPAVDRAALERLLAHLPAARRPMTILHFSREVTTEDLGNAVDADPALAEHSGIGDWLAAMGRNLDTVASRRAAGTATSEDERPLSVGPSDDRDDPEEWRLWRAVECAECEASPDDHTG